MMGTIALSLTDFSQALLVKLWLWQQPTPASPEPTPQPAPPGDVSMVRRIWRDYIDHPFKIGDFEIRPSYLMLGITIFVVAILLSRWVRSFMERRLAARANLDPGIQEERVKQYEQGVREGGIVMGVNARNDEDAEYFENDWKTNRGEHVYR